MTQSPADTGVLEQETNSELVREEQLRRQDMEYGFWTGQLTVTKAVYCLDLSMAPARESLEISEDRAVIESSEELELHRIIYIMGENICPQCGVM